MEQRDPSADDLARGAPPRAGRRVAGFASRLESRAPLTVRHWARNRRVLAVVTAVTAVVCVWYLVARGVDYVRNHPAYQVSYREIILDPPPPPWYRGGPTAFLDKVFGRSADVQTFSTLDVDLERLRVGFSRDPWVLRASRARVVDQNKVKVELSYRVPVAYLGDRPNAPEVLVDRDAVLLPPDDVELDQLGPLIWLFRFPSPVDPRYGEVWSQVDPRSGMPAPAAGVKAAARLAGFLRAQIAKETKADPAWSYVVLHPPEGGGIYIQVGDKVIFRWEDPPWGNASNRLTGEERWGLLRDRVRERPPTKTGEPESHDLKRQGVTEVAPRKGAG